MPRTRYTKAELEQLVFAQLENLNAIHDLLRILKLQNELIENANKKLQEEIDDVKKKLKPYPANHRNKTS